MTGHHQHRYPATDPRLGPNTAASPTMDADAEVSEVSELSGDAVMRALARPDRVVGVDRATLAGLLEVRYTKGASLGELAGVVERSVRFVRALIVEAGGIIRPMGRPPGTWHPQPAAEPVAEGVADPTLARPFIAVVEALLAEPLSKPGVVASSKPSSEPLTELPSDVDDRWW